MLHLRGPRIAIITCQTSRIGEVGRRVTGKERIRGSTWGAPRECREGGVVGNEKKDLPQGKTH